LVQPGAEARRIVSANRIILFLACFKIIASTASSCIYSMFMEFYNINRGEGSSEKERIYFAVS